MVNKLKTSRVPWNKGKVNVYSSETKIKMSNAKKGNRYRYNFGHSTNEEKNLKKKEYYKRNPDKYLKHLKRSNNWYKNNREKDIIKGYIWRNVNRARVRMRSKTRDNTQRSKKEKKERTFERSARFIAKKYINLKNRCDICNSNIILERHHWNYNNPLIVSTLCKECHTIQHTKNFKRWHEARLQSDKLMEVANIK